MLKARSNGQLTGAGLTKRTGLVGGQLYHHLSVLEESGLITQPSDAYTLTLKGANILLMVASMASGVWAQANSAIE